MSFARTLIGLAVVAALVHAARADACEIKYGPYGIIAQAPAHVDLGPESISQDSSPPSDPLVHDVKLVWVDNGLEKGQGGCPDVDTLSFIVDSYDTETAPEKLRLAAFIAPDENGASTKADADILFRLSPSMGHQVGIVLGNSKDHVRDGMPFRSADPYCFTIAVLDEAGNISDRSNATCVNTLDPTAPYAIRVDGSKGCGCGEVDGMALVGVGALGFWRRRRTRGHPSL